MQRFKSCLLAVPALLISLSGQSDTLKLHNGSVIEGQVLQLKDDKIQIETGYGKLAVPIKDIVDIETSEPLWIRLKGEKESQAWTIQGENRQFNLVSKDHTEVRTIEPGEVAQLNYKAPVTEDWQWSGHANAYINYQRGNTTKDTINADGRMAARNLLNRHTLDMRTENEEDKEKKLKEHYQLKYNYDRFLTSVWYLNGNAGWEKDKIKALDHRTTLGLGVGRQLWEQPDLNLRFELGASQIWEEYEGSDENRDTQAGRWGIRYDQLFWDRLTLFHDQDVYRRFKTNSWLVQTSTGIRVKLVDLLHLSVTYLFDYDDDPLPGKEKDDSTLMIGLGASW